ncbi:MAG: SDR family NAD(P)-dependent oxidoreductase, partial [Candidatus Omnitrophica bacterium]|nr:SDR family NAD(P)-dependent oxidoreductase [Candidatus Omnitrophota bacterium]
MLTFTLTEETLGSFIQLTGDESSLHTDSAFAQNSIYKRRVAHGMLPLIYVSFVPLLFKEQKPLCWKHCAVRFLQPIFVGETYSLTIDAKTKSHFTFVHAGSKRPVIQGRFTYDYLGQPLTQTESHGDQPRFKEEKHHFKDIQKHQSAGFSFQPNTSLLKTYFLAAVSGCEKKEGLEFTRWLRLCDAASFCAHMMISAVVGMFLPGRYATFIDCATDFQAVIDPAKTYFLNSEVIFKSISAQMIQEVCTMTSQGGDQQPLFQAKFNVRVDEPQPQTPAMRALQSQFHDLGLKDKIVLITGAGRGIGAVTAKLFAVYGAKVVINYKSNTKQAAEVLKDIQSCGGEGTIIQADITQLEDVRRLFDEMTKVYGGIDVLVNNAADQYLHRDLTTILWEDFQQDIDVIVKGAFFCSQSAAVIFRHRGGGKIINISSLEVDQPTQGHLTYAVAKSGLAGMTR